MADIRNELPSVNSARNGTRKLNILWYAIEQTGHDLASWCVEYSREGWTDISSNNQWLCETNSAIGAFGSSNALRIGHNPARSVITSIA